jgi:hypothetical protein
MYLSPQALTSQYDVYMSVSSSHSSPTSTKSLSSASTKSLSSASRNPSSPAERISIIQKQELPPLEFSISNDVPRQVVVRTKKRANSLASIDTKIKNLLRRQSKSGASTPSTVSPSSTVSSPSNLSCSPGSTCSTNGGSPENVRDFPLDNRLSVKVTQEEAELLSTSALPPRKQINSQKNMARSSRRELAFQAKKKKSGSFVIFDTKIKNLLSKSVSLSKILDKKKKYSNDKTTPLIIPKTPPKTINEIFSEIQKKRNQSEIEKKRNQAELNKIFHIFSFNIPIKKICMSIIDSYYEGAKSYNENEFACVYDYVTFRAMANILLNRFLEKCPDMDNEPYLSNLLFTAFCIVIKSGSDFAAENKNILKDFNLLTKNNKIKDFSCSSMMQMELKFLFTIEFNLIQNEKELEKEKSNIIKNAFSSAVPVKRFLKRVNAKIVSEHVKSLSKTKKIAETHEYGNALKDANVLSEIDWTRDYGNTLRLANMFLELFTNKHPEMNTDAYLPNLKMAALRCAAKIFQLTPIMQWTNELFDKTESLDVEDRKNLLATMDHIFLSEIDSIPCHKGSKEWLKEILLAKPLV